MPAVDRTAAGDDGGPLPGLPPRAKESAGVGAAPLPPTAAGTRTPPLGRKGRVEDKGGGWSGDKVGRIFSSVAAG